MTVDTDDRLIDHFDDSFIDHFDNSLIDHFDDRLIDHFDDSFIDHFDDRNLSKCCAPLFGEVPLTVVTLLCELIKIMVLSVPMPHFTKTYKLSDLVVYLREIFTYLKVCLFAGLFVC